MKKILIVCCLFLTCAKVFAQIETTEQNYNESKAILGEIEKENYFKKGSFDIRAGLLQLSANQPADPVKLNSRNEMPFVEFVFERQIKNRWGVAGSFLHAQNALGDGAVNSTSVYQRSYQLGVQYKVILDETIIKNYITIKLQYYGMSNNLTFSDTTQDFYLKSESGFLVGVERSIPATELFDIRGGFDFIYITKSLTDSTAALYDHHGNGLQMRADGFYNFSKVSRIGLGYSISAFFNKYTLADFEARDRHTQTYKALYLDYNYLF
jgi:hypothetical protein